MSIQLRERTLEVWDGAQTLHNAPIHESVLCLAPHELTSQELNLIAGDARIIKTIEEAPAVAAAGHTPVVVSAAGLALARELLQINALDPTSRIHWQLGVGLMETLEVLAGLELPFGVRVQSINHAAAGTVVTTGLSTGGMLDTLSFHRGVQAGSRHDNGNAAGAQAAVPESERLLQEKLLYILQTVAPLIDAAPACEREHDDSAQKKLIALMVKYSILERKYASLSGSQLGKLTLRLWARKRALRKSTRTRLVTALKSR